MQTAALNDFLADRVDAHILKNRGHAAAVAVARQVAGNRIEAVRDALATHAIFPTDRAVETVLREADKEIC